MQIKINNKKYKTKEGETILDVCRRENIPIPTLCAHGKLKREAVCRLCLVEIVETGLKPVSTGKLVPSCAFPVCEKLEVTTESEKIKKAREINMELLWSDHAGKCVKCRKNRSCEMQNLAEEYKIENFHFVPRKESITDLEERDLLKDNKQRVVVDDKNPVILRTTEYCVECRRCINICPVKAYGFNNRAGDVVVGTPYNKTLDCIFCGACVKYCPTAALTDQNNQEKIDNELKDLNKLSIAIVDPAIFGDSEDASDQKIKEGKLAGVLSELGFEKVFMLDLGLQKYADKLSEEIKINLGKKTIFNSNCAAFSLYIQKFQPEFSDNLSRISIPDELMAENLKTEYARAEKIDPKKIVIISISSCTAKKGLKLNYLDYVLTARELGKMIQINNIDLDKIKEGVIDGERIKGIEDMAIFGGTSSKISEKNNIHGQHKFACANGINETKEILANIKKEKARYNFIECMICPGGCINGGGNAM